MKKMKTPRLPTILNKNIVTFLFAPFIVMVIYHGMPYVYKGVFVIKQKIERIKQPDLSWTMVNVNYTMVQGDAHLIQIKGGKTILIDAGHAEPAKNKLVSFIRNKKISTIDSIFISHPHLDHYGGVKSIIDEEIKVEKIYFNIPSKKICNKEISWGCNYDDILKTIKKLQENGVEVKTAFPNQSFDLGNDVTLNILYAFDGINTPVGETDVNDLSLIMMLDYSGFKFLFTGDLNQKIGHYLSTVSKDLTATVIKVPHHGTEGLAPNVFFEKVNAEYALIPSPKHLWCSERSARPRNWFKEKNVPVFVNGFHGNIEVMIKNRELKINVDHDTEINCEL